MSEFHAAVGLRSLAKLSMNLKNRRASAKYLMSAFKKIEPKIEFQTIPVGTTSTYYVLSAYIDSTKLGYTRDQLHDFFYKQGIMTRKYFFPALHEQTAYKKFAPKKGSLPVTDMVTRSLLSLPLYSHISKEDMNRVIKTFADFKATI